MANAFDNLMRIVSAQTPQIQRLAAIKGFAEELEWTPSYEFKGSFGVPNVEDHLVVEHGLENSAIISFLQAPARTAELEPGQLKNLLAISFNNLIEWHIFVSETEVRFINNLDPKSERIHPITRSSYSQYLSGTHFDEIATGPLQSRQTLQACDDIFIQVLSRWKRLIKADYRHVDNRNLSALFNAIIFVRGSEDRYVSESGVAQRNLLGAMQEHEGDVVSLAEIIRRALDTSGVKQELGSFINTDNLEVFDRFDRGTAFDFFKDFYRPSGSSYEFNFALMSKHALSRIYEKYVSLLEFEDDGGQFSFVSPAPSERASTKSGSIYTPQFIAGFFARFLRDNVTPRKFRSLKSVDPACGSGIFLRTLLELQCNPLVPGTTVGTIREAFDAVTAIDRDANACEATRLSLALLYLVAIDELPNKLEIINADAIRMALGGEMTGSTYDAVLANPPYVKLDHLNPQERETYGDFLGDQFSGRLDSYLAFIKLCLDIVANDGFVCLVLPHVFLSARNASALRRRISREYSVRCLIDLAAVTVFEGVGAYNVLLILQRRLPEDFEQPLAQIALIKGLVGPALQACLEGRVADTPYYNVFEVPQNYFDREEWTLLAPAAYLTDQRLSKLPKIADFLTVAQGFVSGADDVFILPKARVPKGEESIFADYLPDRSIGRYALPNRVAEVVFYPFIKGKLVAEEQLQQRFPLTWRYLNENRERLSSRPCVRTGVPWWRPERPRDPDKMLRPKIVGPHLMLTPRFAVDDKGRYVVSRSPVLVAPQAADAGIVAKYFCAILNSSIGHWWISAHAPKYGNGYNRLEVSVLRNFPAIDPSKIPIALLREIVALVDEQQNQTNANLDRRIDDLVCDLYELGPSEREQLFGTTLQ